MGNAYAREALAACCENDEDEVDGAGKSEVGVMLCRRGDNGRWTVELGERCSGDRWGGRFTVHEGGVQGGNDDSTLDATLALTTAQTPLLYI
jgi:hypothetical protein